MTLRILENGILKILLNKWDMKKHKITKEDIDENNAPMRSIIEKFIKEAQSEKGFKPTKSVIIETLSFEDGCLVFVTPSKDKYTCDYRSYSPRIFSFSSLNDLYRIAPTIERQVSFWASSLYKLKENYLLMIYPQQVIPKTLERLIGEFGEFAGNGANLASFYLEHASPLAVGNAVESLSL